MDVFVTGMTPSQAGTTGVVSRALARALEEAGHHVELGRPNLEQVLEGRRWDHAFVGLGALHTVGSSHAYGALGVIGSHWEDALTLYLDDLDAAKIMTGLRMTLRKPTSLTGAFWIYRDEYGLARRKDVFEWLSGVVRALVATDRYPTLLVPAFGPPEAQETAQKLGPAAVTAATPLDLSVYLDPPYASDDQDDLSSVEGELIPEHVTCWWGTEEPPMSAGIRSLGPYTWPVYRMHRTPSLLTRADGYLTTQRHWTSRLAQMTGLHIPVVTSWEFLREVVGEGFGVTASTFERLDATDRVDLAYQQNQELQAHSPSPEQIQQLLDTVMQLDVPRQF